MKQKINILLLVSYFPPDNHVGAWRWGRLVGSLPTDKFNVSVVTVDNNGNYNSELSANSPAHTVKRIPYPYGLSFRKKYQRRRKSKKHSDNGPVQNDGSVRKKSGLSSLRRWLSLVVDFPDFSWRGSSGVMASCEEIIKYRDIDIIIASHPYLLNLRCASLLSAKYRIPWIADMRDALTGNLFSPYLDYPFLNYCLGLVENKILSTASRVVIINEQLASTIKCQKARQAIISNAYENRKEVKKEGICDGIAQLVYTGSVKGFHFYRPFLDGLKLHLAMHPNSIIFNYYGRDFKLLDNYARLIDLQHGALVNHGYVDNAVARAASVEADLLVMFGWSGRFGETYQSGKIFDYLSAGTPVLAVDLHSSCVAIQVAACQLGSVAIAPPLIAKYLGNCITSEDFLKDVSLNFNYQEINKYSVDSTSNKYARMIESVALKAGSLDLDSSS